MRLAGIYSNPIIVSGYDYNLLIYPVSNADIRIRISAEGVIRTQIQRISAYPYPNTAQKPYPDNLCCGQCGRGYVSAACAAGAESAARAGGVTRRTGNAGGAGDQKVGVIAAGDVGGGKPVGESGAAPTGTRAAHTQTV